MTLRYYIHEAWSHGSALLLAVVCCRLFADVLIGVMLSQRAGLVDEWGTQCLGLMSLLHVFSLDVAHFRRADCRGGPLSAQHDRRCNTYGHNSRSRNIKQNVQNR